MSATESHQPKGAATQPHATLALAFPRRTPSTNGTVGGKGVESGLANASPRGPATLRCARIGSP